MGTTLSQSYAHSWDTFHKGSDAQGAYYTCDFLFNGVPWSESDSIHNQIMGLPARVGGKTVYGDGPMQHPLSPNLRAVECDIEGIGAPITNAQGYPNYDSGFVAHVKFRTITWLANDPQNLNAIDPTDTPPILWCTQELDFATERFTVPNHQFKWQTLNKPMGVPILVKVGITIMKLTFEQVPYMPSGPIKSLRGKVNNAPFLGGATGCVYYRGGRTIRTFLSDGTVCQRCEMVFEERDKPWVQFMRNDSMTWDTPVDGSGNKLYTAADLSPLISL
jgi:hypothetical protein